MVYKNGIRTTEFFCDRDKLRSGVVTENQVKMCICYFVYPPCRFIIIVEFNSLK